MLVVSEENVTTVVCQCRRLPSGESIYQFEFIAYFTHQSVILSADRTNLVCAVRTSPDESTAESTSAADCLLFTIRRVDTGHTVAKAKPNYPEFRYRHITCIRVQRCDCYCCRVSSRNSAVVEPSLELMVHIY